LIDEMQQLSPSFYIFSFICQSDEGMSFLTFV
jgi:hypothetical protein